MLNERPVRPMSNPSVNSPFPYESFSRVFFQAPIATANTPFFERPPDTNMRHAAKTVFCQENKPAPFGTQTSKPTLFVTAMFEAQAR